jgi:hypothetical protein
MTMSRERRRPGRAIPDVTPIIVCLSDPPQLTMTILSTRRVATDGRPRNAELSTPSAGRAVGGFGVGEVRA